MIFFKVLLHLMLEMRVSRSISDKSKHKRKSIFSLKSCRKCAFLCQFFKTKKSRPDILIYEEVRKFPAILAKKITWIPMVTEPI